MERNLKIDKCIMNKPKAEKITKSGFPFFILKTKQKDENIYVNIFTIFR